MNENQITSGRFLVLSLEPATPTIGCMSFQHRDVVVCVISEVCVAGVMRGTALIEFMTFSAVVHGAARTRRDDADLVADRTLDVSRTAPF